MSETIPKLGAILKHMGVILNSCSKIIQICRAQRDCYLCSSPTLSGDSGLCSFCLSFLPAPLYTCARCGLALPAPLPACGGCLTQEWPIKETIALGAYEWPLREWIVAFKHQQHLHLGRLMGEALSLRLQKAGASADFLVPMPLHLDRLKFRGFNQASELARVISKQLKIPIAWDWAIRAQATPSQADLSKEARRKNVRSAFKATVPRGARIAIIDDVVTTGSTCLALANTLLEAGAAEVKVWCVARVQIKT